MTDLMGLAERCEKAEPSYELEADIHRAVTGQCPHSNCETAAGDADGLMEVCRDCGEEEPYHNVKRYSTSLDAAMTLVPEKYRSRVTALEDGRGAAWVWMPGYDPSPWAGFIATPALALCAASLRALSSLTDGGATDA